MPSILSTNMASLYAQRNLASAQAELAGSVQKLSSGRQINSAKDNAAGLGISEGVMGIKNITDQSIRSTQNAISVVQAAEGARDVVGKLLQRVLTLTTQKENTLLNSAQTSSIDSEITSLLSEVGKIRDRTRFQGGPDSIFGTDIALIAGAGVASRTISIRDLSVDDLGVSGSGSSKTINSSDLTSLFSRQIAASGISVPTAQTMTSVPPSSVTGSALAVTRSAVAATLNGGQSATASNPTGVSVQPTAIQPGTAPLPVASVGLTSRGDVRFSVDRNLASTVGGNGASLLYTAGSGSSIQGLVSGGVYQIGGAVLPATTGDYSFQLRSGGAVIERLGAIVGSNFSFQRVQTTFQFNPIDTSGNVILGSSINLADDAAVVFTADSSSLVRNISNLDLGKTYYIQNVLDASGNSIGVRLKNISGTVINFDASQADGSFSLSGVSPVQVGFNSQNIKASTLNLTGSAFQVDDQVRYTTDVQDLDALQTGDYFVKTVTTVNGNNSIQLARTLGGSVETFEVTTGGGTSTVALISRAGGVEADTITSAAHGFQNGDAVKYTSSSVPNEIGGLDTGKIYYVVGRDASGNSFKLSETLNGNPVDLTSAGVSTQTFAKATVFTQPTTPFSNGNQVIYDGIASSGAALSGMTVGSTYAVHLPNGGSSFQLLDSSGNVVSSTGTGAQLFRTTSQQSFVETNAITIAGHGFQDGDVIKYSTSGGQIGNLPTSGTYYARDVSGNTFKLASTFGGTAIDLSSSGSGTQTFTKAAFFNQPTTPYIEGAQVVYDGNAGGSNIAGLTVGSTYKTHLVNGGNSFQLLDVSGNYVATTNFGGGTPLFRNADQLPYVQTDTITISGHGFQNGDAITYSSANPITNLSNNSTYYVRDVSGNDFKLSISAGGSVRDLTGYGSGTQSFTKGTVFNQPATAFANGAQVVYGGADASGNAITGLTVNATYTVHNIGNGSSFQLLDSNNKVVSTSSAGAGNQIFNTASSSLYLQAHGFRVGDQLTYSGATGASSSDIGNLARGTYAVKAVTADTFQLENPANTAAALSFTSAGSGIQQFTSGSGPISSASVAAAIQTNARYQAELGMQVNALNFAIDSMETLSSNLAQAYSRIMDVDYATETAALTRNQIMQQAATSMLAQANQMPNVILTLLK